MLDSLIDDEHDAATNSHRYIAYYPTPQAAGCHITAIAQRALASTRRLPQAAHHALTVSGIAAFYLSAPKARNGIARQIAPTITDALKPTIVPVLAALTLWRHIAHHD